MKKNKEDSEKKSTGKVKNQVGVKIALSCLIIFAIVLSLYKFSIYLSEPKFSFFQTIDVLYKDFRDTFKDLENNTLIKQLKDKSVELNSEIGLESSNLVGYLRGLEEKLNTASYTGNIRINKLNNYFSLKTKMNRESIEEMNIDYLNSGGKEYFKSVSTGEDYIDVTNGTIDLLSLDYEKNSKLTNILKEEILQFVDKRKFKSSDEAIAVNNKTVDCKKTTYSLSREEYNNLISNIVAKVQGDANTRKYVSNLLRTNEKDVAVKIRELAKLDEIDGNSVININSYVSDNTHEGVKFEIVYLNGNTEMYKLSYIKDFSFHKLEVVKNGISNSVTLSGSFINKYILTIVDDKSTYILTVGDAESVRTGVLKVLDNSTRDAKLNVNFSYNIVSNVDTPISLTSSIKLDVYDGEKIGNISLNINGTINNSVDIEPIKVNEYKTRDEVGNIRDSIINYMKNINTPSINDLPLSFTE